MESPEEVVQAQLEAYNAKDLERLISIYADDAELYEHPATLLAKGGEALRARFRARFQEPNLHAKLLNRIVMGSVVIDHEEVTRTSQDGPRKLLMVMIYEVHSGRIAKAWVIPAKPVL